MPLTNPPNSAKVTMEQVENWNTIKGIGNGTIKEKVSGKPKVTKYHLG